jgi:hypothetical protein
VRTSSKEKQSTQQLKERGIPIVTGELEDPIETLTALLRGIDIVICSMSPAALKLQIPLVDAAVAAGVKLFLPCNFGTPVARGILATRDAKEEVHDHIFRHHLGFTIVDTGFWYQANIPRVPSGKFDNAIFMPAKEVYAGGLTPNMLIDARDVGRIVVRVLKDKRTLNKRVMAYGAVLSQNQTHEIIEDKTGEKPELTQVGDAHKLIDRSTADLTQVTDSEALARLQVRQEAFSANPELRANRFLLAAAQYAITKYVRGDNTAENARYLGYVDANELFPDFRYTRYEEFVDDLIAGRIKRPYPEIDLGA